MEQIPSQEVIKPTIDLASSDFSELQPSLELLLEKAGHNPNKIYESIGRTGLIDLFSQTAPDSHDTLINSKSILDDGGGFLVVSGIDVYNSSQELIQLTAITVSSIFGEPTRTDKRLAQIAWPIRYNPDAVGYTTFSQNLGEAEYHTDTQYFEDPEKYFSLLCVNADVEGKGTNKLIDGSRLVTLIDRESPELGRILRLPYPFRVPTVFTESGKKDDIEIIWQSIFEEGKIRYRKDTILSAINETNIQLPGKQLTAINALEGYICKEPAIEHHLLPGQAIFVNNHRLLHSRTSYDDPSRLLYRVRMDEVSGNA